jgi:(p)ppGpp synthase/HD superfamily hydrolase
MTVERSRLESAFLFASELHRDQTRKGTPIPYIFHLMSVASLVAEGGGDENQIIAALLHDAVEDSGGANTREEIERRFGEDVAELVDGCTDTDQDPKPPWRARKEAFLRRLNDEPPRVLLICAADKLHNARSTLLDIQTLGDDMWGRFRGGKEGTLWYFDEIVKALSRSWNHPYIDELARTLARIRRLTEDPGT